MNYECRCCWRVVILAFFGMCGNMMPYLGFIDADDKIKSIIDVKNSEVIYAIGYTIVTAVGLSLLSLENMWFVEGQKKENTEYYNNRKLCFVYEVKTYLINDNLECQIYYRLQNSSVVGGDVLYLDKTEVNRCDKMRNTYINCWMVDSSLSTADHVNDVGFQKRFTVVYIVYGAVYFVHWIAVMVLWIRSLKLKNNRVVLDGSMEMDSIS